MLPICCVCKDEQSFVRALVKENNTKLEEGLNVFKSDRFNADSCFQSKCSLNEKVNSFEVARKIMMDSRIETSRREGLHTTTISFSIFHFPRPPAPSQKPQTQPSPYQ
uniref:Uncharacterized protein n=1 Tax=Salix viminalis TaxID=40686 RepID=A0A6N2LRQ0_SALVM